MMRCIRISMGNDLKRNELLTKARDKRRWTQLELAEKLGVAESTVRRWERGYAPSRRLRSRLCDLFGMTAEELGIVPDGTQQLPKEEAKITGTIAEQDPNRQEMLKRVR